MRKFGMWLPLVAVGLILVPLTIAGCGGGSGGRSSGTIASFSNGFAELSDQTNRNATLSLKVRDNQTVKGTLSIVNDNANPARDTTFNFPVGNFPLSGEYTPFNSGSSFTARGTFSNLAVPVPFIVTGTLPTNKAAGSFTISGTYQGASFSEEGTIPATNGAPTATPSATPSATPQGYTVVYYPSQGTATIALTNSGSGTGANSSFTSTTGTFDFAPQTGNVAFPNRPALTLSFNNANNGSVLKLVLVQIPDIRKGTTFQFLPYVQTSGKGNQATYTQGSNVIGSENGGFLTVTNVTASGFTFSVNALELSNTLIFSGAGTATYTQ